MLGVVLLACKAKSGFLFNVVGSIFYFIVGCLEGLNSLIVFNFVFVWVNIWSWKKWGEGKKTYAEVRR